MAKSKRSWRDKLLDSKDMPKVVEVSEKMSKKWGTGTCVIPAPIEVDEIMRSVPEGKLITINIIRERLAKRHNASFGCPITTGIFAGIAARAAEEDAAGGKKNITPYWRTLKEGGVLNEKFPGGMEAQSAQLTKEGHIVEARGKKVRVKDFDKSLVEI